MKHFLATLSLIVVATSLCAQKTFDVTINDSTYHMKQYWFVLYTTGPDTTKLDSATSASLLQQHLAHQGEQAKRGLIQLGGPFGDDSDWRGLLLYDCDTREEVEGYLKQDPFVKRGKLVYQIHPWFGSVGTRLK
jgi:hypothetical protein